MKGAQIEMHDATAVQSLKRVAVVFPRIRISRTLVFSIYSLTSDRERRRAVSHCAHTEIALPATELCYITHEQIYLFHANFSFELSYLGRTCDALGYAVCVL